MKVKKLNPWILWGTLFVVLPMIYIYITSPCTKILYVPSSSWSMIITLFTPVIGSTFLPIPGTLHVFETVKKLAVLKAFATFILLFLSFLALVLVLHYLLLFSTLCF